MIDAAANSYMHVAGSQWQRERNAELEWAAVNGEDCHVTTQTTAAKETRTMPAANKTILLEVNKRILLEIMGAFT